MEILKIARTARSCLVFTLVVIMASLLGAGIAAANAQESLEYPVKGAYLFKFCAFVEWPNNAFPGPNVPFVIGILGADPFGSNLDEIVQNRTVQGRPVIIKRYKTVEDAKSAHILYIGTGKAEQMEEILTALRGTNVLTVSDESKDAAGIINFVVSENKVRFEIDPNAANRAGLKVSSKLLSVATVVDNEKRWPKK